jgi:hypothetical protein
MMGRKGKYEVSQECMISLNQGRIQRSSQRVGLNYPAAEL